MRCTAVGSLVALVSCSSRPPTSVQREHLVIDERPYLIGQLHAHSDASGDSDTPADEVARWYRDHGFDFVVLTDHNRVTESPSLPGLLVIPGVEITLNLPQCVPAPAPGLQCLLHVNAWFAATTPGHEAPLPADRERYTMYRHALGVADDLGALAQLNHPNFHFVADADLIAHLADDGLQFLEVANEAIDSANEGDREHPSTEALWDEVLSRGKKVWGTATDDAHHYGDAERVRSEGGVAHVGGRGFVGVRADRDPAAIRAALAAGDFWFSNGPRLRVASCERGELVLEAETADDLTCIGDHGKVRARARGTLLRCAVHADDHYVRAIVGNDRRARAWTQPCFR